MKNGLNLRTGLRLVAPLCVGVQLLLGSSAAAQSGAGDKPALLRKAPQLKQRVPKSRASRVRPSKKLPTRAAKRAAGRPRISASKLKRAHKVKGLVAKNVEQLAFVPDIVDGLRGTKLKIVYGGGEFIFLESVLTVNERQMMTFQWTTNRADATSGAWEVRNASAGNVVVASGTSQAPGPGGMKKFYVPADGFILESPPVENVEFVIRVSPLDVDGKPLGQSSTKATVIQLAEKNMAAPTKFIDNYAYYPTVEVLSYGQNLDQIPTTQFFASGANIKLRLTNHNKKHTSRVWLSVTDYNTLVHTPQKVSVSKMAPGQSKTVTVNVVAKLPPPKSQMPQAQQRRDWRRQYEDRCGLDLRVSMNWRGHQNDMPHNPYRSASLVGTGWNDYVRPGAARKICGKNQCVSVCEMEKSVRNQLGGHTVGYGLFLGQHPKFVGRGYSRTDADGGLVKFSPKTKVTVASVSKLITAIGAMRILADNGVKLDDAIGPYFPNSWVVDPYFRAVTFAQLLSQRSGIMDYGNVDLTYAKMRSFFGQTLDASWSTSCQPAPVVNPANPVNQGAMGSCYSNYNTAVLRILLPKVAKFGEDTNTLTRPQTLAYQYEGLVRQAVFDPIGQSTVGCRSTGDSRHALAYNHPGDKAGYDWGDVSLICGAAGWSVSVEDMAKVLASLDAKDGKILVENTTVQQFRTLRQRGLGLDIASTDRIEKNGGWGMGCDSKGSHCGSISTSAGMFGPEGSNQPKVTAILFINSDISGGPSAGKGARQVLTKAYNDALKAK